MTIEIVWSGGALRRLQQIHDYVAKDKPEAAKRLGARITAVTELLRNHPHLGRVGVEPGVRELVIGGTLYVVLYRVRGKRITVSTVWHGAQPRIGEAGL